MRKVISGILLAIAIVAGAGAAYATGDESTVYVIKKGDTLWGLSERFIKDPHYWPNMWANNNPLITNAHFIFPGQKIRIYADRIIVEPSAEPAQSAPPDRSEAAATATLPAEAVPERMYSVNQRAGFLLEKEAKPAGHVIATYHERRLNGENDTVYTDIGREEGAKVGSRFSIFRNMGPVNHPVSNAVMGDKIIPLGVLQLTEVDSNASKAVVTKSLMDIDAGTFLLPYRERRNEIALKAASRDMDGYIIDSQTGNKIIGAGDVVFLDLGARNGIEVGNMLYICRDIVLDKQYVGRFDKVPKEALGALVVVEKGEKTSTALVVKSAETIYIGDQVGVRKSN